MRRRSAGLVFAGALSLLGAACSDGGDDEAANDERYCELTAEIEGAADETFSALGEDANEEETAEAQQALLDDVDDELDELVEVAPDDIADDVEAFVESFRASMRGEDAEPTDDEAIVAWEEEHCSAPAE